MTYFGQPAGSFPAGGEGGELRECGPDLAGPHMTAIITGGRRVQLRYNYRLDPRPRHCLLAALSAAALLAATLMARAAQAPRR
jgi:hypothetical protein